nr:immunoglobulin light chain junction region [Macaca mulatta]MOV65879.1 immunoglobulin light chain junction region [Macaca mulatta]MOV65881.1 immunoglobulin light chain junction region [Macaca mulatta]MOV66235.1 immunoglobulin light chain junction region [Macaca mulatta]MOV66280.1 immunoglobulin light chain junction region [Macaca mulatta]
DYYCLAWDTSLNWIF